MPRYGYARVSTTDQDLAARRETLERVSCAVIRGKTVAGTSYQDRAQFEILLTFLQFGDGLVVIRIDQLKGSVGDVQDIARPAQKEGRFVATGRPINTTTAAGKAFIDMPGVFAAFETGLRRERQMEGISKANAGGYTKAASPASMRSGSSGPRGAARLPSPTSWASVAALCGGY